MGMKEDFQDIQEVSFVFALQRGEPSAVDYFFNKYAKQLYRFAFSYLKSENDAEEIVQEIFLKIWEKRKNIDPNQAFKKYLFTIALNSIRKSFLQKAKEEKFKLELYNVVLEQNIQEKEEINYHLYLRILDEQIELLPEKRKEIFVMHKKEGLTVKEVSEILNISPKTVENQLTSAIKSIRDGFYKKNMKGLYMFYLLHSVFNTKQLIC